MRGRTRNRAGAAGIAIALVVFVVLAGRGDDMVPAEAWAAPDAISTSDAIAFFERRLGADPGNALFMANLAGRYMKRFQLTADVADVARAERLARGLLDRDPDPAVAHARLASVL